MLLGQTELTNLSMLVISASVGVLTSRVMLGDLAVLPAQRFVMRSYWEISTYAILGIVFGILAALYVRFFNGTAAFFERLRLPRWMRVVIGMLARVCRTLQEYWTGMIGRRVGARFYADSVAQ